MHLSLQYRRIIDLGTKSLNVIPNISSDTIFNITLNSELDLTIFVQILEDSPQFQHKTSTVHKFATALIVHI